MPAAGRRVPFRFVHLGFAFISFTSGLIERWIHLLQVLACCTQQYICDHRQVVLYGVAFGAELCSSTAFAFKVCSEDYPNIRLRTAAEALTSQPMFPCGVAAAEQPLRQQRASCQRQIFLYFPAATASILPSNSFIALQQKYEKLGDTYSRTPRSRRTFSAPSAAHTCRCRNARASSSASCTPPSCAPAHQSTSASTSARLRLDFRGRGRSSEQCMRAHLQASQSVLEGVDCGEGGREGE